MTNAPTADTGQRCMVCEYNLTVATNNRCPECGWEIDWELVNFRFIPKKEARIDSLMSGLAILVGTLSLFLSMLGVGSAVLAEEGVSIFVWSTLAAAIGHLLALLGLARGGLRKPNARLRVTLMLLAAGMQITASLDFTFSVLRAHPIVFWVTSIPGTTLLIVVALTGRRMEQRERFRDAMEAVRKWQKTTDLNSE